MVRTNNKTTAPVTDAVVTETPVPEVKETKEKRSSKKTKEVAAAPAPVAADAAKAPRAKKAAPAPAAAATAETPAVPAAAETPVPEAASGNQLQTMVNEQGQLIQKLLTEIVVLKNNHKMIEKQQARELKNAQKAQSKSKSKGAKKEKSDKPSSFELPTEISGEIARFVGVNEGTKLSRTEVNKKIHEYVTANKLNDSKDRRTILPDEKLRVLLRVPAGAKLGYFNLQTYLSGHFATRQRAPLYK